MEDPEKAAWHGGMLLGSSQGEFRARALTKAEWQQHGAAAGAGKWDV